MQRHWGARIWRVTGRMRLSGWPVHRGCDGRRGRETEAEEGGRGRDTGIRGLLEPRAGAQLQHHRLSLPDAERSLRTRRLVARVSQPLLDSFPHVRGRDGWMSARFSTRRKANSPEQLANEFDADLGQNSQSNHERGWVARKGSKSSGLTWLSEDSSNTLSS